MVFQYSIEWRVFLCCDAGFTASEIEGHLKNSKRMHREYIGGTPQIRAEVQRMMEMHEDVIKTRADFAAWVIKLPRVVPRPYNPDLQCVRDYLGCTYPGCGRASKNRRSMQEHAQSHEGWYKPATRGKKISEADRGRWFRKGVFAQRLFRSGIFSQYWVIDDPPRDGIGQEDDVGEAIRNLFEEGRSALNAFDEQVVREAPENREPNPLLKHLGYAKLLSGFQWSALVALGEPVSEHEDGLRWVEESIGKVLDKARWVCSVEMQASVALHEIERITVVDHARRPLRFDMGQGTWEAYTRFFKRILRIIIRANHDDLDRQGNWLCLPYVLSEAQSGLLGKLADLRREETSAGFPDRGQDADDCPPEVETTILQLVEELLDHESGDYAPGHAMVVALAISAMKVDRRWQERKQIGEGFSAFLKISRIVVLYTTFLERKAELEEITADGSVGRVAAMGIGELMLDRIRNKVNRFMVHADGTSKSGPMAWVLRNQAYLFKAAKQTVVPGKLEILGGDKIRYDGVDVDLGLVRTMFKAVEIELYQNLARLLLIPEKYILSATENGGLVSGRLFETDQVRLPESLSNVHDAYTNTSLGYCWLKDTRNEDFVSKGDQFLMRRMSKPGLRERWLRYRTLEGGRLTPPKGLDHVFHPEQVGQYGIQVASFLGKLLFAMHVTGGQPGRGTEVLTLRLWNTEMGGARNIIVRDGLVAFITAYWKRSWASDNNIIWRYLPDSIGRAVLWYQWLVLPFWTVITSHIKSSYQANPFLWDETVLFEKEYSARQRVSRYLWLDAEAINDVGRRDEAEPDLAVVEANRRKQDNVRHLLGERPWTAARFSDQIRKAFAKHVEAVGIGLRAWRQIAVHIGRVYLDERFVDDFDEEADVEDESTSAWDLAAAHGTVAAKISYANTKDQNPFGNSTLHIEQCRRVSKKWHVWIGMATPAEVAGMPEAIVLTPDESRILARQARALALANAPMEEVLTRFLGSDAVFRGKQRQVVRLLARQERVLWIAPTGRGKSMAFMLPAYVCPSGITVVVVPLNQLKSNLHKRAREHAIQVVIWSAEQLPTGSPAIVFVTPEAASKPVFQSWYMLQRSLCLVDRVVFDECHCILEAEQRAFREVYLPVTKFIMSSGVPVLFQTATLPPYDEADFFRAINAPSASIRVVRESTTRKNIAYEVVVFEREAEGRELLKKAVDDYLAHKPSARGMVFCPTKALVEQVGGWLGVPWVHADVATDEKTKTIYEWFDRGGVIVATDVLGMGIDIANVRFVYNYMAPGDLSTYVQQSGRGGRDGRRCLAVLITRNVRYFHNPTAHRGRDKMQKYVASVICRRILLDEAMDGTIGRRRCLEEEQLCDICRDLKTGPKPGPNQVVAKMVKKRQEVIAKSVDPSSARKALDNISLADSHFERERKRAKMNTWIPSDLTSALGFWIRVPCVYCQVREGGAFHLSKTSCDRSDIGTMISPIVDRRASFCGQGKFKYQGCYGSSFACLVPQFACTSWVPSPTDKPDKRSFTRSGPQYSCRYAGILDKVVASGLAVEFEIGKELGLAEKLGEMGYTGQTRPAVHELWTWLILPRRVTPENLQASNLVEVFMHIHQHCTGSHT